MVRLRRRIDPNYLLQRERSKTEEPLGGDEVDSPHQQDEAVKLGIEDIVETGTVLAPCTSTSPETQCHPEEEDSSEVVEQEFGAGAGADEVSAPTDANGSPTTGEAAVVVVGLVNLEQAREEVVGRRKLRRRIDPEYLLQRKRAKKEEPLGGDDVKPLGGNEVDSLRQDEPLGGNEVDSLRQDEPLGESKVDSEPVGESEVDPPRQDEPLGENKADSLHQDEQLGENEVDSEPVGENKADSLHQDEQLGESEVDPPRQDEPVGESEVDSLHQDEPLGGDEVNSLHQQDEPVKMGVGDILEAGLVPCTSPEMQCHPENSEDVTVPIVTVSQDNEQNSESLDKILEEDEAEVCTATASTPSESEERVESEPETTQAEKPCSTPSSEFQPETDITITIVPPGTYSEDATITITTMTVSPVPQDNDNEQASEILDVIPEEQEAEACTETPGKSELVAAEPVTTTTQAEKPCSKSESVKKIRSRIDPAYLLQRKAKVEEPVTMGVGGDAVDSQHQQTPPIKLELEVEVAKEDIPEAVVAPSTSTPTSQEIQEGDPENSENSEDVTIPIATVSPVPQDNEQESEESESLEKILEEDETEAEGEGCTPRESELKEAEPVTPPQQEKPCSTPTSQVAGTVSLEVFNQQFEFMHSMFDKDEVSTPKGPRHGKLPKSPDFPTNKNWIKPEVLLGEMFKKRCVLRSKDDDGECFKIPVDPTTLMTDPTWHIPELMVLKRQLNEVKSLLDYFPLNAWHKHTKQMNISNLVVSYVKKYFNPEFSSQAWGKMFEILCSYDVIPSSVNGKMNEPSQEEEPVAAGEQASLDSVHLCEAPGAFVSALNHFLKVTFKKGIDWNWLATTLSPYYEGNDIGKMINDDRLILKSMNHWTFLEDSTGNLMSTKNMNKLIEQHQKKLIMPRIVKGQKSHRVLLVTADGSIDCQNNPAEQEGTVAHLQYCEIIAALQILQRGGSFILKIFTFLESATICHLYLLSCAFQEVQLFKPSTSKEGNSEVYVICLGFLGDSTVQSLVDNQLFPMLEQYGDLIQAGKTLLPLNLIPPLFIDRITKAAEFFCNYQMKIIRRNASCFPCSNGTYEIMKPYRKEAAEQWIDWSDIRKLLPNELLFTSDSVIRGSWHVDPREERGTFADKVARADGDDMQKLTFIRHDLATYVHWIGYEKHVLRVKDVPTPIKVGSLKVEKPYDNVRCSRFCNGRILSDKEVVRDIAKKYLTRLEKQGVKSSMENACSGHNETRILEIMEKIGNPTDKSQLKVLCFKKTSWEFLAKTDYQNEKEDLTKVLATVNGMKENESLFLCRFPMLTRLQAGLIYRLAGLFEQATIYADLGGMEVGIMLYKLQGVNQEKHKDFLRFTDGVLRLLVNEEGHWPVLELAPMKTLIEFLPSEFLLSYNVVLLVQDTNRTILVTELAIGSNLDGTEDGGA